MKIVAFGFEKNISEQVLKNLKTEEIHALKSDKSVIQCFVNNLFTDVPELVLGLGMYSGRDKDKLRIETSYNLGTEKFAINYFLEPSLHSKLSDGIGNSYCNFVSGLIMEKIKSDGLNTRYSFIHIPKSFDVDLAVSEIEGMLSSI